MHDQGEKYDAEPTLKEHDSFGDNEQECSQGYQLYLGSKTYKVQDVQIFYMEERENIMLG